MQTKKPARKKLLVRHVILNRFLSPAGRWVRRAEAAFNFPNLLNAVNTCLARELQDVEIILGFDGKGAGQRISLDALV